MSMKNWNLTPAWLLIAALGLWSCGKGGEDCSNGSCDSGGGGGEETSKPTVDVSGASGLLVSDPTQSAGKSALIKHNEEVARLGLEGAPVFEADRDADVMFKLDSGGGAGGGGGSSSQSGEKSLSKTDDSGNVSSVVSVPSPSSSSSSGENKGPPKMQRPLPRIMTIAISNKGDLFLHFKTPFRHQDPKSNGANSGGPDDWLNDGSYCQIFRVKGGAIGMLRAKKPDGENLECLSYGHFIDEWSAGRLSVFQFDGNGNAYFPARTPGQQNMIVYKWERATGKISEVINANIFVQDFLVTQSGGIFYTGTTDNGKGGGGGGGGGFFRYVSGSTGALTEIAQNWWNFVYDAKQGATTDKAIFFGPDPTSAQTASWNSACLFAFDPDGGSSLAARTSKVITCGDNIWGWVQMSRAEDVTAYGNGFQNGGTPTDAWKTEYKTRCESSGQVFAGGGSQISAIKQNSSGTIYVIGNLRKKNAGTLTCNVEVRGPHCKINGSPAPNYTTEAACTAVAGASWVDEGRCNAGANTTSTTCIAATSTWNRDSVWYNGAKSNGTTAGDICTKTGAITGTDWWSSDNTKSFQSVSATADHTMKFRMNWMDCSAPASSGGGDQWTTENQALAVVDGTTKQLKLLSESTERALGSRLWIINNAVYYSSFNTTSGKYALRYYDSTTSTASTMIDNFEVYNLSDSGIPGKLYFDGLNFGNNQYIFGTVDVASPYSYASKTGLTGQLKTVVIVPKNL